MNEVSQPTTEQRDQAAIVHAEIIEVMNRLTGEGIDWRVVLAGATGATANLIAAHSSADRVPIHFANASAQTMHLGKP